MERSSSLVSASASALVEEGEMGLKYLVLLWGILVNAGCLDCICGFGFESGDVFLGGYLGGGIGGEKEGEECVLVWEVFGREEKRLWFGSEARIAAIEQSTLYLLLASALSITTICHTISLMKVMS